MKKYILSIILLISFHQLNYAQCSCELKLTDIPGSNCCYTLSMKTDACQGQNITFGSIGINTAFSSFNPCEIQSLSPLGGTNVVVSSNTQGTVSPNPTWNNTSGVFLDVAEICFTNGPPISLVELTLEGTDVNGTLVSSCPAYIEVDGSCGVSQDCECDIDYVAIGNCTYEIGVTFTGNACPTLQYTRIDFDAAYDPLQACEIKQLVPAPGLFAPPTGSPTDAYIVSTTNLGANTGRQVLGEITFENNITPSSKVLAVMNESSGSNKMCDEEMVVNASCVDPTDCNCLITYNQTSNCCYELQVQYQGADCPNLSFTDVLVDAAASPQAARHCEIKSVNPATGFSAGPIIGNTQVTFSTGTNMGNSTNIITIGEVCFENGNPPVSNPIVTIMDNSGTPVACDRVMEVDATCPPPTPVDKIMGDSNDNIPKRIIPAGPDKLQVLGNTTISGTQFGTLIQYDLTTQTVDFQTLGPPNTFFSDVAYHPGTGESFIVGIETSAGPGLTDNQSLVFVVDGDGFCTNLQYYTQTGREQFRMIEYLPNPNNANVEFYITGAKNPTNTPAFADDLLLFTIDRNLNIAWSRKINHTGDDEMYRGIIPRPNNDGVIIVGNDSNNNRGAWVEIDGNGAYVDSRTLDARIDLYDGQVLSNGNRLLLGTDLNNDQAIITLWDASHNLLDGLAAPHLKAFEEIATDGTYFYTLGEYKNPVNNNRILKFEVVGNTINVLDEYLISDNETDFIFGAIDYHPAGFLLYADARIPAGGPGGFDTYFSALDLAFNSNNCILRRPPTNIPFSVTTNNPPMSVSQQNIPTGIQGAQCGFTSYICLDYCIPVSCNALFTWMQDDCHAVTFTDGSSGIAPLTYSWDFNGDRLPDATTPNPTWDYGGPGTFNVCLTITGADGCQDTYCQTVTVTAETTPPLISCPGNISVSVPACDRGDFVNFALPTATDNCDSVMVVCSHQPGDFFPCGTTTVTCTATDMMGNSSTCSFNITVNCNCLVTDSTFIECSNRPDEFNFSFQVNNISGGSNCNQANISVPASLGTLNITSNNWVGNQLQVSGSITTVQYPFPTGFPITVAINCTCPDGLPITCTHDVFFTTPCCDSAWIDPGRICTSEESALIDISFFGTVQDIVQIDYYVKDAPCTGGYWGGIPFQTSLGYQPLRLSPPYHNADVCVYAKITLGDNEEPCDTILTDISTLTLCNPYDCDLNDQEYCYMGSPIQPSTISYSGPTPDCAFTVEWYDENGNLVNLPPASFSYTPSPVSFTGNPDDCFQDFTYEMRIIGACGPVSCFATVRLWNDKAPIGDLSLDPIENLPLCYGEDVSIHFDKACVSPADTWTWESRTASTSYQAIPGAGTINPVINTNRLFEDTWVQVTAQNGTCPAVSEILAIPVKDPIQVISFDADPNDPCRETGVKLSVQYTPCVPSINGICDCDYKIEWFRNGQLIGSTQSNQPTAGYSYVDPALNGNYGGVYYAEVTDRCCGQTKRSPVARVEPPITLALTGQCYICDPSQPVTISALIGNAPASGTCTYQWYYDDGTVGYQIIGGATGTSITVTKPGFYKLEMVCVNGAQTCMKMAEFELIDCFTTGIGETFNDPDMDFSLSPNPGASFSIINIEGDTREQTRFMVTNTLGQKIQEHRLERGQTNIRLDDLPRGTYLITMYLNSKAVLTKKLVIN